MSQATPSVSGTLLDEDTRFTLRELCQTCSVDAELVIEMTVEGVIEPQCSGRAEPREWQFSGLAVRRVITAMRLQRDLRVNMAGAALALDLLDELYELRYRRS